MGIKIDTMSFSEGEYSYKGMVWKASTLCLFAKEKGYPVFDLPLAGIDLSCEAFDASNLKQFVFQCKRVNECSLDYPIILDDHGIIADGYHRVCKAILEGRDTIKAIRLEEMPAPFITQEDEQ